MTERVTPFHRTRKISEEVSDEFVEERLQKLINVEVLAWANSDKATMGIGTGTGAVKAVLDAVVETNTFLQSVGRLPKVANELTVNKKENHGIDDETWKKLTEDERRQFIAGARAVLRIRGQEQSNSFH